MDYMQVDQELFDFAYDQYKIELELTNTVYARGGFLLTAFVVLGSAGYGLGRSELLPLALTRVDLFLYFLSLTVLFGGLCVGIVFLLRAIFARDYSRVATLGVWRTWQADYLSYATKTILAGESDKPAEIQPARRSAIFERLAEAHGKASKLNQLRLVAIDHGIKSAGVAVVALGASAFLGMILKLQGI